MDVAGGGRGEDEKSSFKEQYNAAIVTKEERVKARQRVSRRSQNKQS